MKYKVELLNFDSDWVTYSTSSTKWGAKVAQVDLIYNHHFQDFQVRISET